MENQNNDFSDMDDETTVQLVALAAGSVEKSPSKTKVCISPNVHV